MRYPPLQAPLLWHTYLAFWIAGLLAAPWPLPAGTCALLLFWADDRLWRIPRGLLALVCLAIGLLTAQWQLYGIPLRTDFSPLTDQAKTAPARFCGVVRDTRGLSDNRLRLVLADVRAVSQDSPKGNADLPGLVQWTWEAPTCDAPLPGQTVCLTRRLLPATGFANDDLPDWKYGLAARGIRWRLWSRGDDGAPLVSGRATLAARWRENLRQALCLTLVSDDNHGAAPSPDEARTRYSSGTAWPQGKAVLLALLFGDRRYLSQTTIDLFADATLAHSLALSGQHLAVAGLAGWLIVLAAARRCPDFYLRCPRLTWTLLASLPPALLYLWLGNAPASLIRATIMLVALTLFILWGRPHTMLDALCIALLVIVAAAPLEILDTGLQLSALCVATIGLSLPWLRWHTRFSQAEGAKAPSRPRRVLRALWRVLLISLILQVALLPLNLRIFGNMGHWFALNVLWLPVVDVAVLPLAALGLLCTAVGLENLARLVLELASLPCQWLVDGLSWLAHTGWLSGPCLLRPHWTAIPAFAALLVSLAARTGRSTAPAVTRRLALAGMLLLLVGPILRCGERFSPNVSLNVLDVGQSQALALRLPGHTRMLVDGGGSASPRFDVGRALTGPAMTRNDAPRLAAVLNTHPDLDHMGGLLYVLRHFDVPLLLDNGHDGTGEKGQQWHQMRLRHHAKPLRRGDRLLTDTPGLYLEILHPPAEEMSWQGNNASVVARLVQHDKGHDRGLALFTGDAERPVLQRLLDNGDDLRAEVLVAPHHGSRNAFLKRFYEEVRPRLVIASCGWANRYDYPAKSLRAWLAKAGIPLLYTGRDGEIRVVWSKDAFTVWTKSVPRR